MNVIETDHLTKSYGSRVGVRDLDLRVAAGSVHGFIGPNGAGKTTTIRLLLGFLRADSGTVRVFDQDAFGDSHQIKRSVGYLPGDLRLHDWMSTARALEIFGQEWEGLTAHVVLDQRKAMVATVKQQMTWGAFMGRFSLYCEVRPITAA